MQIPEPTQELLHETLWREAPRSCISKPAMEVTDVPSQPWEIPANEKKAPVLRPLCGRVTRWLRQEKSLREHLFLHPECFLSEQVGEDDERIILCLPFCWAGSPFTGPGPFS